MTPPTGGGLPDAGFNVMVTFVPDDPVAPCNSVTFERAYAVATQMKAGSAAMPGSVDASDLPAENLVGLSLSQIDRVENADGLKFTVKDTSWRIYAPPGTASISIPAAASPFSTGQEVWLTVYGAAFDRPFDYDLFPLDLVTTRQVVQSEDSFSLTAP
jgi:hypothetical protein